MTIANSTVDRARGKIGLALKRMVDKYPFHVAIVERFKLTCRDEVGTMGVTIRDDDILLLFNPAFVLARYHVFDDVPGMERGMGSSSVPCPVFNASEYPCGPYRGSFLNMKPTVAVVTNIDREHLDYYNDLATIREAFRRFLARVPFYGAAVVCLDDANIRAILPGIDRKVITYGLGEAADLRATGVTVSACQSKPPTR